MDAKKMLLNKDSSAWMWAAFGAVAISWAALPSGAQESVERGVDATASYLLPSMPDCSFHRPYAGMSPDLGTMAWCMVKGSGESSSGGGDFTFSFPFERH